MYSNGKQDRMWATVFPNKYSSHRCYNCCLWN